MRKPLLKQRKQDSLMQKVVLIVSDNPKAKVIERAAKHGIPVIAFDPKSYESKTEYEEEIVDQLENE